MFNGNLRRKLLIMLGLTVIATVNYFLFAQDNPEKFKDKMDNIKGEVQKITITTDEGETVLEGEEAKMIFDLIKFPPHERLEYFYQVFDDSTMDKDLVFLRQHRPFEKVIRIERDSMRDDDLIFLRERHPHDKMVWMDKGEKMFTIKLSDSCDTGEELMKKIQVEDEDGVKKVTVTTTEDGEENVEVYEGEDADEYLKELHGEGKFFMEFDAPPPDKKLMWLDEDMHKHHIQEMGDKKIVEVEKDDDKTKVTITTFEDGKEKVEVLEGEEADKWLKENEAGDLEFYPEEKTIKVKIEDGKVIIDKNNQKEIIIIEK